jgi:hypothetical protein
MVQLPGGVKPSLQPASGLGKEISVGGPKGTWPPDGKANNPVNIIMAKPGRIFRSASGESQALAQMCGVPGRLSVPDWANPLASSSNLVFMFFLSFFVLIGCFSQGKITEAS